MANDRRTGLEFRRVFSDANVHPFDQIEWERRTAEILDPDGKPVFRQEGVEVPRMWSQTATNIVFDKYTYGSLGTEERESSVRQIIGRVSGAIVEFGDRRGYFASTEDRDTFHDELDALLVNQYAAFNSPVWFNVGCRPGKGWAWDFETGDVQLTRNIGEPRYQGSACFIVGVKDEVGTVDDLESVGSIARNAMAEMAVFKYGSGAGSDRSRLRSCREPVSGGGRASGPVSFMRVYDAIGAVTKSGGITRRAAKMEILRCDHPDIMEFIACKRTEERKAKALIAQGYEANFNGEAYNSVLFQNSNLSVRATDAFLRAVEAGEDWQTFSVVTGRPEAADGSRMPAYAASQIMDATAEGTWHCGDPGIQYDDTINQWHTIPNSGRIWSSNPCSEYLSIDDSACNLASLNLLKFRCDDGSFDVERFRAACRVFTVAMDILVDLGCYPTPEIARNAHRFRQLGLGYTNLGALLMANGLPYDSDEGRGLAGAVTAILTGQAYLTSAEMGETEGLGAFEGFVADRENMLRVMEMHRDAAGNQEFDSGCTSLWAEATRIWHKTVEIGYEHGYRNSQATVLAPTGTISFMMDADTTGIEPALSLIVVKNLWGRGKLRMVNQTVLEALRTLGYNKDQIKIILNYVESHDTIEDVVSVSENYRYGSGLLREHLPIFDCALPSGPSGRTISWRGHLEMMAAVQPFISGAISKTVNVPGDFTVSDIREAYMEGWRLGLKAVAIYRDGSKDSQPISAGKGANNDGTVGLSVCPLPSRRGDGNDAHGSNDKIVQARVRRREAGKSGPYRERLPDTRQSTTHKFRVGTVEGFLTVGHYPDGRPGEVFVSIAKAGSTVNGLVGVWSKAISVALQYGMPVWVAAEKFCGDRFDPCGLTSNPDIPNATSVTDYVARWLGIRYRETDHGSNNYAVDAMDHESLDLLSGRDAADRIVGQTVQVMHDGQTCPECGNLMVRTGSCHTCSLCGFNYGC